MYGSEMQVGIKESGMRPVRSVSQRSVSQSVSQLVNQSVGHKQGVWLQRCVRVVVSRQRRQCVVRTQFNWSRERERERERKPRGVAGTPCLTYLYGAQADARFTRVEQKDGAIGATCQLAARPLVSDHFGASAPAFEARLRLSESSRMLVREKSRVG